MSLFLQGLRATQFGFLFGLLAVGVPGPAAAEPGAVPAPKAEHTAQPDSAPADAAPIPEFQPRPDGPVAWVRTLQLLQDRIAAGSLAAHESQLVLIARINGDLLNAAPEVWTDPHNLRAAIVFALSGGGPAILRRLVKQDGLGEPEMTLARGALAYVEGREAEASRLLKEVDIATLPPTLAGAIGLTQASLAVTESPTRAIGLLDQVRLLLPGTLAEEGALRREIFTLGQTGDLKRFEALAVQYLRRFPHSIYAGNFRQRLAYQVTKLDVGQDSGRFSVITGILDELDPDSRKSLYLLIARTAIEEGKTGAAFLAADRALALCAPESLEASQARLYQAAAEIVSLATFQSGLRTLRAVDRTRLPRGDSRLLDTALATAEEIQRGLTGKPGLPEGDTAAPKPAQTAADAADEPARLIPRAQATIDRIDLLLKKANP
ncbi:chemotaxis protein [Methylobacterium sp. GC_Met_2]|uniref:chemotaxis protein n=1 Tax=Methylobacterium sp. GC_Met_2 TaxID=2937376 RepID=UPI00226B5A06|nr:chemotaxis protein [Methylobacterium sp. GC_Met_2]